MAGRSSILTPLLHLRGQRGLKLQTVWKALPLKTSREGGLFGEASQAAGCRAQPSLPLAHCPSPQSRAGGTTLQPGLCWEAGRGWGCPPHQPGGAHLWLDASLELSPFCSLSRVSVPSGSPLPNSANLSTGKEQEVTGRERDAWGTGDLIQSFQLIRVSTLGTA